jgi:hypothetical protein
LSQQRFESLKDSSDLQAALSLTSQPQYQQLRIQYYKDSHSNTDNSRKEKKKTQLQKLTARNNTKTQPRVHSR